MKLNKKYAALLVAAAAIQSVPSQVLADEPSNEQSVYDEPIVLEPVSAEDLEGASALYAQPEALQEEELIEELSLESSPINKPIVEHETQIIAYLNAKQRYALARKQYDRGAEGFFEEQSREGKTAAERKSAALAQKILLDKTGTSQNLSRNINLGEFTDPSNPKDAAHLENIKEAIELIKVGNARRVKDKNFPGLTSLKISHASMAVAQKQVNWSDQQMKHSEGYGWAENLAFGHPVDPYKGWYDIELDDYNKKTPGAETGHYENLVDSQYSVTGLAVSKDALPEYQGVCQSQVFDWSGTETNAGIDVDTYLQTFNAYYARITTELAQAQAALDAAGPNPGLTKEDEKLIADFTREMKFIDEVFENKQYLTPKSFEAYRIAAQDARQAASANDTKMPAIANAYTALLKAREGLAQYMWRVYNKNNGEHLFTIDKKEYDYLKSLGWTGEGNRWIVPAHSNRPMVRLYNKNSGEHHYTANPKEAAALEKQGWNNEGTKWYTTTESKGMVVHRMYNPNAGKDPKTAAGAHHYTMSNQERDALVKLGWNWEHTPEDLIYSFGAVPKDEQIDVK